MNRLRGTISNIEVNGNLSLVTVHLQPPLTLKTIVVETPKTAAYLQIENEIDLLFKETEVVLGTAESPNISLQNRISGTIREVEQGQLLSKVLLETKWGGISSIISSNAVRQLGLSKGMNATAFIKLNEIMLSNT
nr:TOBE domain-containing protein [Allomuricauda sp.]